MKWSVSCSVVSDCLRSHGLYQNTGAGSLSLLQGSSQPRDWTRVFHIVGRRFTIWATREVQGTEGSSQRHRDSGAETWVGLSTHPSPHQLKTRTHLANSRSSGVPCHCLVTKSCQILCNPVDYSSPSSSVHGISQARILEWFAILFYRVFPTRDQTCIFCIGRWILYHWAIR